VKNFEPAIPFSWVIPRFIFTPFIFVAGQRDFSEVFLGGTISRRSNSAAAFEGASVRGRISGNVME
jgi:hypothetical protein